MKKALLLTTIFLFAVLGVAFASSYSSGSSSTVDTSIITAADNSTVALTTSGADGAFDPSSVSDLLVWYKADSLALNDGDAITTWADSSGNGHDLTGTTTAKPTYQTNEVNSKPVVRYDGSNDCMSTASLALDTHFSIFVVAKATDYLFIEHSANATSNDGFYFYTLTNGPWLVRRTASHSATGSDWFGLGAFTIGELVYNGAGNYFKNGTAQANGNITGSARSDTVHTADFYVGARACSSVFSEADYAEVLVYSRPVTSTERSAIRSYLATKYNITAAMAVPLTTDIQQWKVGATTVAAVNSIGEYEGPTVVLGDSATGSNSGTTVCIDSSNKLCACGSCA